MKSDVLQSVAISLICCFAITAQAAAPNETASPAVKKSDAGICHDQSSPSYHATKNFASFASMDACVKSGGRAPASQSTTEPAVKKSESGICHDKSSASFAQTKKFTEFKTVDECVKSGGTLPKK